MPEKTLPPRVQGELDQLAEQAQQVETVQKQYAQAQDASTKAIQALLAVWPLFPRAKFIRDTNFSRVGLYGQLPPYDELRAAAANLDVTERRKQNAYDRAVAAAVEHVRLKNAVDEAIQRRWDTMVQLRTDGVEELSMADIARAANLNYGWVREKFVKLGLGGRA